MAFRFPLQTVFHFRQSIEHQQEMLLRAANQRVARVRHLMEQLEHSQRQAEQLSSAELTSGTTAAEMHLFVRKMSALRGERALLERELARTENLRDQQQQAFHHARQQREAIQSLREHQFREYTRREGRRAQRRLDDLFLLHKLTGPSQLRGEKAEKTEDA